MLTEGICVAETLSESRARLQRWYICYIFSSSVCPDFDEVPFLSRRFMPHNSYPVPLNGYVP